MVIPEQLSNDERLIDAKYYADKSTLENPKIKISMDDRLKLDDVDLKVLNISPESYKRWLTEQKNNPKEREELKRIFEEIKLVLRKYLVMKEEYYDLVALWIIGTYSHKDFSSYPYLFFNAMKGSGKSRTLKLIANLACDGQVMASPTEATLFRTNGTLAIDEFEQVATKEKGSVRELLNASYKKGTKIFRMKKKKINGQEEQVADEFEPYRPIVIANIWGMEEVLGDRCIQLILEKSADRSRTKLVEDFEDNHTLQNIKNSLVKCRLCSVCTIKNIYTKWNEYVLKGTLHTLHTHTTYTTPNTQDTQDEHDSELENIFKMIDESDIYGRNLELFMPLFLISYGIDKEIHLKKVIEIAKEMTNQKKHEEQMESLDVLVINFIATFNSEFTYNSIKAMTNEFRRMNELDDPDINPTWFGRALKRINLVVDRKRTNQGIQVMVNSAKAKELMKNHSTDSQGDLE